MSIQGREGGLWTFYRQENVTISGEAALGDAAYAGYRSLSERLEAREGKSAAIATAEGVA